MADWKWQGQSEGLEHSDNGIRGSNFAYLEQKRELLSPLLGNTYGKRFIDTSPFLCPCTPGTFLLDDHCMSFFHVTYFPFTVMSLLSTGQSLPISSASSYQIHCPSSKGLRVFHMTFTHTHAVCLINIRQCVAATFLNTQAHTYMQQAYLQFSAHIRIHWNTYKYIRHHLLPSLAHIHAYTHIYMPATFLSRHMHTHKSATVLNPYASSSAHTNINTYHIFSTHLYTHTHIHLLVIL